MLAVTRKYYSIIIIILLTLLLVPLVKSQSSNELKMVFFFPFQKFNKTGIYDYARGYNLLNGSGYLNTTRCILGKCVFYPSQILADKYSSINSSLKLTFGNQISVSFWIRLQGTLIGANNAFIQSNNIPQTGTFRVYMPSGVNNGVRLLIVVNSSYNFEALIQNTTTGSWYNKYVHVVAIFNGTHGYGYINGTKTAVTAITTPLGSVKANNSRGINIGLRLGSAGGPNDNLANFDEVYIFNRSLRDDEVKQLFNLKYSQPRIRNITFRKQVLNSGINYTRNLSFSISLLCFSNDITRIVTYINKTIYQSQIASCNNQTSIFTSWYQHSIQKKFNITIVLNNTYHSNESIYLGNRSFTSDLTNPSVVIANATTSTFTFSFGTASITINTSHKCTDVIYPSLRYKLVADTSTVYSLNLSNATLKNNRTTISTVSELLFSCGDPFGNTTFSISTGLESALLILMNEKTGRPFVVSNLTSARIWVDGNSTYYDLKTNNRNNITYFSNNFNKLRVELGYKDGTFINRYIDISLLGSTVQVCANNQTIPHYDQFIISGSSKPVEIQNSFFNCYIIADYTRFGYQDGNFILASTSDTNYNIYGYVNGIRTFLSSLDGKVSTNIYLDSLLLGIQQVEAVLSGSGLSIRKREGANGVDTKIIDISYLNIIDHITSSNITIYRRDNDAIVLSQSSFANSSNWSIAFNYAGLLGISNNTVFEAVIKNVVAGSVKTVTATFTTNLGVPVLESALGFTVAFLLLIFGLTLTKASTALGFFGGIITVSATAILAFTEKTWYVNLLLAVTIVIIIYMLTPFFYQRTTEVV
jgi:hypothetical protein